MFNTRASYVGPLFVLEINSLFDRPSAYELRFMNYFKILVNTVIDL